MPTIYDQLLDQQAPAPGAAPPSDNPYDALLDQEAEQQRKRLQVVLQDAVKTSPEAAASAQQLAKQTGLPVATVERNLEEVRQRALVQRINTERLQASSPVLARQLMDPEFAKLAHDDIDSMVEAERTLGGFAQDVGVTALKGAVGLPQAFVGLADIATLGYAGKGLEALGIRFNETQDILNGMYSTAQQRANTRVQEADGFFNTLGAMAANPSTIAATVGESLPQMIGGAGIARGLLGLGARGVAAGMMGPELPGILARTLGSAASVAAGAAGEGAVSAGSAAEQFRADNPDQLLTLRQAIAATLSGAMTGGLSMAAGRVAQRLGIEDVDAALAGGRMGVTAENADKGLLRQMLESVLTEGVLEELPQSAQEQMWQNIGEGKPVFEGVGNAAAMGLVAGAVTGVGFNAAARAIDSKSRSSLMAELNAQRLEQLNKIMAANKVLQRDPDAVERFAEQATEQGVKDFYLDAQTLMQSGLGEELAAVSPAVAEQLPTAIATGGQVHLTVAEYAARVAGTELAPRLVDHIRVGDPNGFSRVEAQEYMQTQMDNVEAEVAKVLDLKADDLTFRESYQKVKNAVRDRLNELGSFAPHVNEFYATQQAAYAAARASRLGVTPEQFYQDHLLRIESERGVGPQYDQNGIGGMVGSGLMGINVRNDSKAGVRYADEIVDGKKKYETRDSDSLRPYVGKRVAIVRTGEGQAKAIGEVTLGEPIVVNEEQFRQMQAEHLVPEGSTFDVKPGGVKYLYPVTEASRYDNEKDVGAGIVSRQVLNQSAKVTTGRPIFKDIIAALGLTDEEVNATAIEYMTGMAGGFAFLPPDVGGVTDVVAFLHARRMESGLPVLDISKPEDRAQLARLVAAEALAAIRNAGSSLEWYDTTVAKTLATMAVKYPELNADANARNAFLIATAIASQGLNVEDNLAFASEQYEAFRKTGKFPIAGKGESSGAMEANFNKANELLAEMGPTLFGRFLVTPFTVRELQTAGFPIGGETMDTVVLGSAVFGPKIGFGFYSNLSGNFEPVTMDMWFMRLIGRLAGTLPAFEPEKFAKQVKRFRDALKERGAKARGLYASQFDKALVNDAKTDDGKLIELARLVKKAHEKDFKNNRAQFDSKTRVKTDLVAAAETILFSLEKPKDVPASGGERNNLRDVVAQVVDIVAQQYGSRVPPAALQALVWYPEQELYKAMGVKLRVTSQDYAGAARKLLEGEGFDGNQLDAAAQLGSAGVRPANGGANAGAVQGNGQGSGRASPLQADERTKFLIERNARIVAEQRAAAARIAFEVAPDPNDVELTARWRQLNQQQRLSISDRVARAVVPKVMKALKAKGEVLEQVGSYLEDTNPSFALRVDKGDVAELAKTLGFVLSQDSMMALAPEAFPGAFEAKALRIEVGEKTAAEVDQIYQALRAITLPDGRQPIAGQSTSGGAMTVLLDSQDDATAIAALVDNALANAYRVGVADVFAAFPEKQEYDYARVQDDPAGDEGVARQRARDARAQASELLRKELDAADAQLAGGVAEPYTQDILGNPLPAPAGAGNDGAGAPRRGRAARFVTRDDVPGRYARRTELVKESTRTLGTDRVTTPEEAAQAFTTLARGTRERFDALVTNKDGKPIAIVGATHGTTNASSVFPGMVAAEAHRIKGAANIWFGHNHPSGVESLSRADESINERLTELFRGTDITPRGILAIAGSATAEGRLWTHTTAAGKQTTGRTSKQIPAPTEVPVVERLFTEHGTLGDAVTGPATAKMAVRDIARGEAGLVLLDNRYQPVGFLPLDLSKAEILRRKGGVDDIARALSMSNANTVLVANDGTLTKDGANNLATLLQAHEAKLLDVIDQATYESWSEKGRDPQTLYTFEQSQQGANRGSFNPALNLITLLQDADLSTFLHESAHYFFETDIGVVQALLAKPELTPGEQQIVDDVSALLKWHGLEGTPAEQLAAWNAMSFEEKRVAHERTAEAYEHYLFEGKAPSLELESAFRAFTTWMKRVYTSIRDFLARNPGAGKLNDEIRQVFDRMLATDEQIRIAEAAREMAPLFATEEELAKMGLDPAAYQLAQLAATQASMEYLGAKGLKDMKWLSGARGKELKRLQREVAEQRAKMREQVEAEVLQQPIYQAIRWLTKGVLVRDGEEIKAEKGFRLNTATVKAMYPDSVLSKPDLKRLRGMTGPEGLEPDMVAEMFGFASGDALIRAIVEATPMKEEVDGLTDQRMLETYGDLTTKEGLEREADKAVHTELRARVLATESNALDKALGRPRMLAKAAKLAAERTVAKLLVKNVRPKQYGAAEAKAGRAAAKAFKAGDIKTAADEKRRQLFNNYAAKAAYEAQDDVRAILKFFRHIASLPDQKAGKTRNMDVVAAARAILAEHGYGQRTKGALEYLKAVEAYDPQTYQALVEMIADAGDIAPGKPVEEMTVEELRALNDEVKFIWNIAKRTQEVIVDGERRQREDLANELADRLEELGAPAEDLGKASAVTPAEERALRLSSAKAWLRRVEHWVDMLDGSKMGIFRRYVFQPIKEAADRYRADKIVYLRAFRDAFDGIGQTMQKGLIDARELGYTFGKDEAGVGMNELLHAILHTGNESNKRKLLLGRGWATENEDGTLNTARWDAFLQRMVDDGVLTRDHFDFAQKVWDLLEQTKPLAQKAHRDAYGKYFSEVTANEFTVQFPDGSSAVYRGGYVPAMTDARIVKDAELKKLVEEGNDGVMHAFPGAAKGFTKSRVEYNRPLLLDLRTLPQHIDRVLLFSHLEMPVRDAGKLLANRRLAGTLNRYDAGAISQMLMPWLNRTARQQVTVPVAGAGWMARWINTLRNRTSLASMFANVSNALQQVTGFAMASVKVKPSHLASAMAHYLKNPKAMAETVAANSVYMSHRMENEVGAMMGEVDKILLDPTTYEQTQEWVKRHQFFLQSAVDNVMGPVIWTGAYNEALEEGYSHKDAVRIADSVIRTTQGSTLPEDVSSIEVQNAFLRVFLQFAGYFNMQANLLGGEFGKLMRNGGLRMGMGRGLYVFTMGFLAPAMVAELIAQAFKGGPGDDDKDGEYLDDWLMALLVYGPMRNGTAFVPGAGQLVNSAVARFNSNPTDDRVSTAPAVSMLESAAGVPYDLYREAVDRGNHARTIRDVATLITLTTGLPANTLARPISYLAGVEQGKVQPTSTTDAARGLVTGTPSPESRVQ